MLLPDARTDPPSRDLSHWLGIARRRQFHFLIPLFLAWLALWGSSWILPARYTSNTLILVEQPTMPRNYVVPNVNEDLQERLQSITQQILSRSRLLRILDEMNLYPKNHSRLNPDAAVDAMRKDIDIELVRGPDNRISAFKVSYTALNPSVAQEVTNKLTTLFINENLEVRQQASEDTTKFLESQLESARQTLTGQEQKVRAFKGQHVGELPAQLESNVQILSGLQSQLQSQEDALNNTKQQHVYLETLLTQYRTLQNSSKAPDGSRMTPASVDEELGKLRTELNGLRSSYNEQYPEIRVLKDKIARTEKLREQLLADSKTAVAPKQTTGDGVAPTSDVTGGKDLSLVPQLQSQLQANQTEIKNRERSIETLRGQIDSYRSRLNQEPVREQELADLTRGYEQSKASYDELLKKKNDSAMATSMELLQRGERFRIVDPPSLPLKPTFPNRLRFCGIGLFLGIALGLAVVWAAEAIDDRVHDEANLKQLLRMPVLSEIPVITDPDATKAERKRVQLGLAAACLVFAVILAGSAISYWKG
jgi:polysaccharide chain length determinant protein (PEP-CTERM system associated)